MMATNDELKCRIHCPTELSTAQDKAVMDTSNREPTDSSPEDVVATSQTAAVAHRIEAIMKAIDVPLLMPPNSNVDSGVDLERPDNELPDEVIQARPSPWEADLLDDANKTSPLLRHNAIVLAVRTKRPVLRICLALLFLMPTHLPVDNASFS